MTSLEASVVHVHERMDGMQRQLDNIGGRLDRIERRLELAGPPSSEFLGALLGCVAEMPHITSCCPGTRRNASSCQPASLKTRAAGC